VAGEDCSVQILVVEDEPKVAGALRDGLGREGYDVTLAGTGEDGFYLVNAQTFDLIVLDRMLPGRDGLEVLATLRKKGIATPVLVLTARDSIPDRVIGLDSGADDYLVKPFAMAELLARVRMLLRRGRTDQTLRLKLADLDMDLVSRHVFRGTMTLHLTSREFELLEYFLRNSRQVVSREMIARDVWKETGRVTPLDNVIDVHIARLRKKIDEPFPVRLLHTVRGVGFCLREEPP
jgi:two-component system, OmpR family, copper resistance phosphate regulon response regulator CusR